MLTSAATSCILEPRASTSGPTRGAVQLNKRLAFFVADWVGVNIRESSPGLAAGGSSSRICSQAPNGSSGCS